MATPKPALWYYVEVQTFVVSGWQNSEVNQVDSIYRLCRQGEGGLGSATAVLEDGECLILLFGGEFQAARIWQLVQTKVPLTFKEN